MMDKFIAGQTEFVNKEFMADKARMMIVYGITLPYYARLWNTYFCFPTPRKHIKVTATDNDNDINVYENIGSNGRDIYNLKEAVTSYTPVTEGEFWRQYHKAFVVLESQCHKHWEYAVEKEKIKPNEDEDQVPF